MTDTGNWQPTVTPSFTAALLAGGKSRRMGRDKAYLSVEWKGASMPLWERQLAVLQSLAPIRARDFRSAQGRVPCVGRRVVRRVGRHGSVWGHSDLLEQDP